MFTMVCKGREPLSSDAGIESATMLSIEPQPSNPIGYLAL